MKLIIDIREELYYACKSRDKDNAATSEQSMIAHGTPYDEERPHGEWLPIKNRNGTVVALRCSACEQSPKYAIKSDFCPRCGSDNRSKEGDKE